MSNKAIVCITFIVFAVIISAKLFSCTLTDKEAIQITKKFCGMMNVAIDSEPWVLGKRREHLIMFDQVKEVVVGPRGSFTVSVDVNCNNKEVLRFDHLKVRDQEFAKYNIPVDNRKPRNWPTLLTENKAKEIAYSYANKIGLPQDVVFSRMSLDKTYNGTWNAHWQRIHNGYPYEDGSLTISVMAIDGEFYSYGKFFQGKPCPTDVKVSKEKAIEVGRNRVLKMLPDDKANKHIKDYVVTSSELKIVQPNAIFGFITPFHWANSRLAWVVTYTLGDTNNFKSVEDVNFADRFIIKIDAATGSVIGGKFTR